MTSTIIFLTPVYLQYASDEALGTIARRARLVLLAYRGAPVDPRLIPYFARIVPQDAALNLSVRPVLHEDAVVEVVREEIERAGSADAVRIFAQEEGNVLLAARVRARFGIPGDQPAMVERFRDKLKMKAAIAAAGLRIPRHEPLDPERIGAETSAAYYAELRGRLGLPLVVKPINAGASINVFIARDGAAFEAACHTIRTSPYTFDYEVDEFIDGPMYQCDSFVHDGRIVYCGALELGCTNFDFVQGRPLSVYPALEPKLRARLERFNQTVIEVLGFRDGSTHHEIFHDTRRDELVFLEIAARVAGGLGVPYHQLNSNINMIDANLYLSADPALLERIEVRKRDNVVSALLPVGHGTVVKLNEPQLESRYEVRWAVKPGQVVDSKSLNDNAGILMIYNDDPVVLRRDFERLEHYVPVETR